MLFPQGFDLLEEPLQRAALPAVIAQQQGGLLGEAEVVVSQIGGLFYLGGGILSLRDVQIPPQILPLHQIGEFPFGGRLQFPPVLPQLRFDVLHTEELVDLLFGPAGDALHLFIEDPVFVDLPALLHRHLSDGDIVGFGAGKVVERCTVAAIADAAEVHLEVVL